MKVTTSELIGPALDWAVAKCEDALHPLGNVVIEGRSLWLAIGGQAHVYMEEDIRYAPSDDWAQGGPIIELNEIGSFHYIHGYRGPTWSASIGSGGFQQDGPTPLIAAMRCIVASKLGSEVDVPEELV